MDIDDAAKALTARGVGIDDMASALMNLGYGADASAKAVDTLSKSGKSLANIFNGTYKITDALTDGITSIGTAINGALLSPMAKIVGVIAIIAGIAAAIDWAITTPAEAVENMTKSFGEFENAQKDVENLNNELKEAKDSIADLQAKGNLSLVEKSELSDLREEVDILEKKKKIAEENEKQAAKKASKNTVEAYASNYRYEMSQEKEDEYYSSGKLSGYNGNFSSSLFYHDNNVSALVAGLRLLNEEQAKMDVTSDAWTNCQEKIEGVEEKLWDNLETLFDYEERLEAIDDVYRTDAQNETLEKVRSNIDYLYQELDPDAWKQMKIDDLFATDQFSNTKQGLTELAKEYGNLTDFTNAAIATYGEFNTALFNKGISMSDVAENIFSEAGIIDTDSVKKQLIDTFSSVAENTNLDKNLFTNWANQLSDEDLELVYDIMLNTDTATYDLEQWQNALEEAKTNEALSYDLDIAVEQEGLEKVSSAISESASETGLLTETMDALKSRYKALEDFDAGELFENTANGVRLNAKELDGLESEYQKIKKADLDEALKAANDRLEEAVVLAEMNSNSEYAQAYEIRKDAALEEVEAIEQLIAQYEALNGAYAKAMNAASTPNGGALRDNVKSLYDSAKELRQAGKVGTDDFQSFVELVKGGLGESAGIDDFVNAFDSFDDKINIEDTDGKVHQLKQSVESFFKDGQVGAKNFVDALQQTETILGEDWFQETKDGGIKLKVDTESISKALGISEELVTILMQNLQEYGWDIDFDPAIDSADELSKKIKEAEEEAQKFQKESEKIGIKPIHIETDGKDANQLLDAVDEINAHIKQVQENNDITPDYKEALLNNASTQLKDVQRQIQELTGQRIDTSNIAEDYQDVATEFNRFKDAYAEYKALESRTDESGVKAREAAYSRMEESVKKLSDYGEDLNIESLKFDGKDAFSDLMKFLETATGEGLNLPLNPTGEEELDTIISKINEINGMQITIKVDKAQVANAISSANQLEEAVTKLQNIPQTEVMVNAFSNGQDEQIVKLADAIEKIQSKQADITANVTGLDQVNSLVQAIADLKDVDITVTTNSDEQPTNDGQTAVEEQGGLSTTGTITWENDYSIPTGLTGDGTIKWDNDYSIPTGLTTTGTIEWKNSGLPSAGADGTAWSSGSAFANGIAFSRGNWGTKSDGTALGGELGQELVVRDGRFFTIGDKSAEFFRYKKNDIIFNAEQTKQILKQGKITRGRRRGKAMADGTTGRAFNTGVDGYWNGKWYGTNSGSGSKSKKSSSEDDDNIEAFDFIEILIDRIERAIDHFEKKMDNIFDSWENRSNALDNQRIEIEKEIEIQKQAYERYMQQADLVDLQEGSKERIRNGAIDIVEFTEENREALEEYQEWYEKAIDCKDAIDELTVSLSECYQVAFDNVVTQYEQLVAVIEHSKTLLDESISQSEAKGYLTSIKYYEAQIAEEQKVINTKIDERNALIRKRDEALMSGVIVEGSEAWMDMNAEIDACTEEIEAANTSILELNNSIRDTEWEIFDLLQDKISNVAQEADFLISLMSNDKLHDNKGQLTDEGNTTVGLHGQNYNTYMAQADMYSNELAKLDEEIAKDPYNQDLINRRQELLELQRDSILAAEDEKQAIVDLVQEGVDLELESLQELIDTYTEALDAQKDLYDYQKKLAEQTKEIASLEKQLTAYQGSDSEEIKAKVQQIKVSLEEAKTNLEETQYEQFVNEQKKLLDDLYTEYEKILNERLDNVDALIEDTIKAINDNSSSINATLCTKADSVGYTISENIKNIWNGENGVENVLTTYGNDILDTATKVNNTLYTINASLNNMIKQLNVYAGTNINNVKTIDEHATGARKISNDEVAWTQENNKQEYIVRPSDGAILTPVAQDDDILNAQASKNIWDIANNPSMFIRDNLVGTTPVPVVKSSNQTITQQFDKIVFSMPNVTSYSEMLESMKRDKNFERLILALTFDQLDNKSSLRR